MHIIQYHYYCHYTVHWILYSIYARRASAVRTIKYDFQNGVRALLCVLRKRIRVPIGTGIYYVDTSIRGRRR